MDIEIAIHNKTTAGTGLPGVVGEITATIFTYLHVF